MNKENIFKTTKSTMYMLFGMLLFALVSASCGKDAEVESLNLFDENALIPDDEEIKPIEIFTITAVTEPNITNSVKQAGLPKDLFGNSTVAVNKAEECDVKAYESLRNQDGFEIIGTYVLDRWNKEFSFSSKLLADAEVSVLLHNKVSYIEYEFDIKGLIKEGDLSGVKFYNRKKQRQENIQTSFKEFLEKYDVYVTANTVDSDDASANTFICPNLKVKAKKEAEDNGKKYIFNSFKNNGSEWEDITGVNNNLVILGQKHFKIAKAKDLHFVVRVDQKSDKEIPKGHTIEHKNKRDGSRFGIVIVDKSQKKVVFSKLICYKHSKPDNKTK